MPSSSVRTFTDPDEYAAAMRGHGTDLGQAVILGRGSFSGKLGQITFDRLWMARLFENQPRIHHAVHFVERAGFNFLVGSGAGMFANGVELQASDIRWRGITETYYQRTTGPIGLGGVSLPVEYITSIGAIMTGRDLTPPTQGMKFRAPPSSMTRLRRLHAAAGTLAEEAPLVIALQDSAYGLEQALIEALMACLEGNEIEEDRAALRQHAAVMRRFHKAVEDRGDEPFYIPELCREIGTSLRTLNACCQEHLGMGPKHYLLLRRMNLFRRALREGGPGETTVTETATRYGFWHFGRLAVEYKALFGETPSATLARSPD